ncbi:MAG: hypothetical protein U1D55_16245 [Phycisphaerae bacterium]
MRNLLSTRSACRWWALLAAGIVFQLIPFSCGQTILRLVTPVLLDDTVNGLDRLIEAVAPLVLP